MWQRIQTVYLGIALILSAGLYFFPVAGFQGTEELVYLCVKGFKTAAGEGIVSAYPLLILTGILSFLILFQILNFKKRIRQIQTGKAIIALIIVWYILNAVYVFNYFRSLDIFTTIKPQIALFIPIGIIVFILLGNKNIQKDEDLVRSIDRLR